MASIKITASKSKPLESILFIPVSSTQGIGEYSRSLIIAKRLHRNYPKASIHFILNKNAPYTKECPFKTYLSQGSPTKDTPSVKQSIDSCKPDLVIFDCSGRAAQFQYAKESGAKVIFISQHRKKRSKGLSFKRLPNIDLHWVVQPDFMMPELTFFEKIKLNFYKKEFPKNIGAVFSETNEKQEKECLNKFNLTKDNFFLFNAGSGGHKVNGELVSDIFYQALLTFTQETGISAIIVFGSNYPNKIPKALDKTLSGKVIAVSSINNEEFIALLKAAKGRVISAGDTLMQSIQLQKSCVATAISKDQPKRLNTCHQLGLVIKASASSNSLSKQAKKLLEKTEYVLMQKQLNNLQSTNSLELIDKDIEKLLALT